MSEEGQRLHLRARSSGRRGKGEEGQYSNPYDEKSTRN